MYVLSTNTSGWLTGTNTEVRVEFEDDAKLEAEKWSGPDENMVERCVWRHIYNRWDEVQGSSVTFTLSRSNVIELVRQLQESDLQKTN